MKDTRLIVLLDAYLDGELSPGEKQELERSLLESDAARREFWTRASLHGWTHAAAKLNYSAKPMEEVARERRALRGFSYDAFLSWLRRASRIGWKVVLGSGAVTAAVMLWLGIRALQPADDDALVDAGSMPAANTNFIAAVTRGTGVVWEGQTNAVEIGSAVAPQWLRLKSGAVQIEFYSGARVILEGPAALRLLSATEAKLDYGKLSARVPEPAHGFKIDTPDLTVTDLGTEFGLNYQRAQPGRVEVFEGKVEVATDSNTNQQRLLTAGEGLEVNARQIQPMASVDHSEFLSAAELARREAAELYARFQGWKQVDHWLDNDPATVVHFDFEDAHNLDQALVNHASGKVAEPRGMIVGCDWGEGRWPGKSALEFNGMDDRVRLSVPGEYEALTFLAWVRVDSLPNQMNALALAGTAKVGETHWQILRDGRVQFSVRVQGGKYAWDHLVSPPVIRREYLGKWIQLAAVCDSRTGKMALYLNGEHIASKVMTKRHYLILGTLELGNWTPVSHRTDVDYRIRDFHGRMDEFTLLSRPLSTQEIRRQYELGRPRVLTVVAGLSPSTPE